MRLDNIYSSIYKKPKHLSPDDKRVIGNFYDKMLSPISLFTAIVAVCVLQKNKYEQLLHNVLNSNNTDAPLLIFLIVISFFIGARLLQSLYLAKKDYSHIESNLVLDIFTFATLLLFASGFFPLYFSNYNIKFLFIIYFGFSIIATVYFSCFLWRFKQQKQELDYSIEKRIQFLNFITFFVITGILAAISIMLLYNNANIPIIIFGIIICILQILNMIHSGQLTSMPKIILHNEVDSPEKIEQYLRDFLEKILTQESINSIAQILKNDIEKTYRALTISRMNKKDIDMVAESLVAEFGYIFEYIFDTTEHSKLKRVVQSLLVSAFGFGFLGYMNFYSIKNDKKQKIGWIKMHSLHQCYIYSIFEFLSLPLIITSQFGIRKLPKIYKNSRKIKKSQPIIENKELELTYFVIYEQYRKNKYGTSAMNLLLNALFFSKTNNIDIQRLILLVRKENEYARILFNKLGFKEYQPENIGHEPSEIQKARGEAIFLEYH
jgi:ribosomal protein S18 acetylase RimI-like enzyme